ncbi:hypothetical protein G8B26_05905 [Limosilactobacillus reuteri]|nr:hypothetical protein G8B26_05905 [Limosilactobacillus reuteri]
METIVHDPLNRITAKEANARAIKRKENSYKETLKRVYGAIHARVSLGHFDTEQIIDGHDEADYIFNQLVMEDEYAVELSAVNGNPDDHRFKLTISWDSESLIDPDKKYILPMEGTDWINKGVRHYATIHKNYWEPLKWTGGVLPPYGPLYEVQGRDILDAPDWVKAIKPIEVEE